MARPAGSASDGKASIYHFDRDELYDLSRDPDERNNRLAEAPEIRERLSALLSPLRTRASEDVPRLSEKNRRALEALGYVE